MAEMKNYDCIIIGAGAAGLMCALRAGQRGKKVLLLDHADEVGPKILISGGGRCNFTNRDVAPDRYISNNPHFCKSALKSYTQYDFIALAEKHKIPYHEKTLGQLFCDGSAREIIKMLLDECAAGQVDIRLGQRVETVSKTDAFIIKTARDDFTAIKLVMATGSLSIPKMGATGFTHDIAKQFGLALTDIRPGLAPLTFDGKMLDFMRALSGTALEIIATCGRRSFRENMVFTHRGMSGPAILQISSYWREGESIALDLVPGIDAEDFLLTRKKTRPRTELQTILGELLPQRLAQSLTATYFSAVPITTLTDKYLKDVAALLKKWVLTPSGTEGYAKAEVTLGGVDTDGLSSKTMEAKTTPGLYIIGEAVDVTGWLGGYNFQWAWSSGWAAGSAI
jgi:predicted Rossmann fold flavoprotein